MRLDLRIGGVLVYNLQRDRFGGWTAGSKKGTALHSQKILNSGFYLDRKISKANLKNCY